MLQLEGDTRLQKQVQLQTMMSGIIFNMEGVLKTDSKGKGKEMSKKMRLWKRETEKHQSS